MLSPQSRDGIEAFVRRVGGQRFKEHEIVQRRELGNKPTVTYGYLESEEDAEFEVGVLFHDSAKLRHRDNDWRIVVSVDGRQIANTAVQRHNPQLTVSTMTFEEGGQVMKGTLKFTTLTTTDDDTEVTLDPEELLVIGDIQVDLYRGEQGDTICGCKRSRGALPKVDLGVAHERDKKWSGAVGIGQASLAPSSSRPSVEWTHIDKDKPYHRFLFKYRTTPVLQLIKVVGTHQSLLSGMQRGGSTSSPSKRKKEVICIDVSDSEEEDVLITPTKRQRNAPQQQEDIRPRLKTPKVEDYRNGRLGQDVKPFVGLGRAPNLGVNRNIKPSGSGRDAKPDIKPVLTAMGSLSLGGRKRGKTPVLFRFNP